MTMELQYVRTDRNGTKYFYDWTCPRCGGAGESDKWLYTGRTCYACGGTGLRAKPLTVKEYTPEHEAKLMAKRAARQAVLDAQFAAEEAERKAEMERKAEEERKAQEAAAAAEAARKAISQHIGNVGDKIKLTVTVDHRATFEVPSFRGWGTDTKTIYVFVDDAGNKLVWNTTGWLGTVVQDNRGMEHYNPVEDGERVTIKATIKAHGEYQGEKQTELQRVRLA